MSEHIKNQKIEDLDLRNEHVKHYKDVAGKTTAVFYSEPVHYMDEQEKFVEINNELTFDEVEKTYQNKRNRFKAKFSRSLSEKKIVEVSQGSYKVEIDLHQEEDTPTNGRSGFSFSKRQGRRVNRHATARINPKERTTRVSRNQSETTESEMLTSGLTYENFSEGTDLEYQIVSNKLKENIIVKEPSDSYNFSFKIKLQDLIMKASDDNMNIHLISKYTQEKIFTIPAPIMFDQEGNQSDQFSVEIDELEMDNFLYKIYPDATWINHPDRKFPVIIDPQIISNHQEFITVTNATSAGQKTKIRIRNKVISAAFDKYTTIRSAVLELTKTFMTSDPNQKGYEVYVGNTLVDFFVQPGNNDKIQINITKALEEALKNEVNHQTEYIDVEIQAATGNNGYIQVKKESSDSDWTSPKIMVDYISKWRTIDEKSYLDFDVKKSGSGKINLVDGNVEFSHDDIFTDSSILPLKISHVYNNMAEGETFAFGYKNGIKKRLSSGMTDEEGGLKGFADGIKNYFMGKGWKLNIQQQLIKHHDEDNVLPNERLTTYVDGNGNRHNFVERYFYYEDDGKLKDEDGNPLGKKKYVKNEECVLTEIGELVYQQRGYYAYRKVPVTVVYNAEDEIESFEGTYEGTAFTLNASDCRIVMYPTNYLVTYEDSDKKYQVEQNGDVYSYLLGTASPEKEFKVHYEVAETESGLILDTLKSKVCYLSEKGYSHTDDYYIFRDGKKFSFTKKYNDDYEITLYYYTYQNVVKYVHYTEIEFDADQYKYVTKAGVAKDVYGNDAVFEVTSQEFTVLSNELTTKIFYYSNGNPLQEYMSLPSDLSIKIRHQRSYSGPDTSQNEILLNIEKSLMNEHIEYLEERKYNLEMHRSELKNTFDEYEASLNNVNELGVLLRSKQEELHQEGFKIEGYRAVEQEKLTSRMQELSMDEARFISHQRSTILNDYEKEEEKDYDTFLKYTAALDQLDMNGKRNKLSQDQMMLEKNIGEKTQHIRSLQNAAYLIEKALEVQNEQERKKQLNEALIQLKENMTLIDNQLEVINKFIFDLRLEEKKKAMDFVITPTGDKIGFDYYGRLVSYQNANNHMINIIYEDDKITSVIDSEGNSIIFEYYALGDELGKSGNLKSITDVRGRITTFDYNIIGELTKIIHPDNTQSSYSYEDNKLSKAIDASGYGIELDYTAAQVTKFQEFTYTNSISHEALDTLEEPILGQFTEIEYFDTASTLISDKNDVKTAYVFDNNHTTVAIYDYNAFLEGKTPSKAYIHAGNIFDQEGDEVVKYSLSLESNLNSKNILEDNVLANAVIDLNEFENQLTTYEGLINISANRYDYNRVGLALVPVDLGELKEYYIFSGWGKSNQALYAKGRASRFEAENYQAKDIPELDNVQLDRRFGMYAKVVYDSDAGNPGYLSDMFYSPFDWKNKEWQYNALAIKIRRDPVSNVLIAPLSVELTVDYSYNEGTAHFANFCLNQGSFQYTQVNERYLPVLSRSLTGETTYDYNDKYQLIKVTYKDISGNVYFSNMLYNDVGLPTYTEGHDGIVTEHVYDENKKLVRSVTYHKDEPASKFYQDKSHDAKGRLEAEYSQLHELGDEEATKYTYHPKTSLVKSVSDARGNKTVFGYNYLNDALTHISHSVEGQDNEHIMKYHYGYMVQTKHNDIPIDYKYDGFGRVKQISIAGQEQFTEITYEENSDKAILKTSQGFETLYDIYGRITEVKYIDTNLSQNPIPYLKHIYDEHTGNITQTIEYLDQATVKHIYTYDDFGHLIEKIKEVDNNDVVTDIATYDVDGSLSSRSINILGVTTDYTYTYEESINRRLTSVKVEDDNDDTIYDENISYDKQGRIAKYAVENNQIALLEENEYFKVKDHATHLIKGINYYVNNQSKERIVYNYDDNGNIKEVIENGLLTNRYTYDSLNRLIREDNKHLGTKTYAYDRGGNILFKRNYSYTLGALSDENLDKSCTYEYKLGLKDQLVSFDGKEITYDSIGNPLSYQGKTMIWSHGRRLREISGTHINQSTYLYTYDYDTSGIRTRKVIDSVVTEYMLSGNHILSEKTGTERIDYLYGVKGVIGFKYENNYYYYRKNQQGDVTAILDGNANFVVRYTYDAWGNHDITDNSGIDLGDINPFRYRSYYYDKETKLYYLNARYYDPETGRFINADDLSYLDPATIGGLNLYAYCGNNPVMRLDPNGTDWWNPFTWSAETWMHIGSAAAIIGGAAMMLTGVGGVFGGALLTAGVNSLISGYISESSGGSFTAGWVSGGISGFIMGLTAGIGGNLLLSASNATNFAAIGYLSSSVLVSFGGGFIGGIVGSGMSDIIDGRGFNLNKGIYSGISSGIINIFAGFGAGISAAVFSSGNTIAYRALGTSIALSTEAIVNIISYGAEQIAEWLKANKSKIRRMFPIL